MTTSTLTVTEFVTERLYEDEMVARAAGMGMWVAGERCVWRVSTIAELDIVTDGLDGDGGTETPEIATHIARHDPARVLAQCAAMRKIVEDLTSERHHVSDEDCWYTCPAATEERDGGVVCDDSRRQGECECGRDIRVNRRLGIVASIWSDHPDFNPAWA